MHWTTRHVTTVFTLGMSLLWPCVALLQAENTDARGARASASRDMVLYQKSHGPERGCRTLLILTAPPAERADGTLMVATGVGDDLRGATSCNPPRE